MEEEEEDEDFGTNQTNSGHQTLKPKLHNEEEEKKMTIDLDINNKGFFVPKLAGFEYLEGSEILQ